MRSPSLTVARVLALIVALTLALAACGGGGGEGEEGEEGEEEAAGVCSGEALAADDLGLPEDFPSVDGMVLVEAGEQGPSNVADGYFEGGIQAAHDAILSSLEDAGYAITFDEVEEDDSEITYETPDESSTGLVAMRATCGGEEPIGVHITNRPA